MPGSSLAAHPNITSGPDGHSGESDRLPRLSDKEFREISRFAYEHFGLDLPAGKKDLVTARLARQMRQGRFSSYSECLKNAAGDPTGQALAALVNALTTNHTSFYREPAHFDFLKKLAQGEFAGTPVLRVWSAACSTGEEVYTIAACLVAEAGRSPRGTQNTFEIRATDISTKVLSVAAKAVYPTSAANHLPGNWLRAGFLRGHGASQGWYRVRPDIAAAVRFEQFNLVDSARAEDGWHIIFCRNVMIYFDKATQERVVARLASALVPGGYLFVGHSESFAGINHSLQYVQPAVYRRPERGKRT